MPRARGGTILACQALGTVLKEPQRVPLRGYGARTAKGGAS